VRHRNQERKDANPQNQAERVTVREGEQQTREDKCAAAAPLSQPPMAWLRGPILDSVLVKSAGVGGVAVLACWVLCRSDNPVSPNTP